MKFWERIFLYILIIFEIFFVPSSIYLFNNNFKLNLNEEVNSAIEEHQRLCSFIKSNLYVTRLKYTDGSGKNYKIQADKENIDSMLNDYLNNFENQNALFEILDEEEKTVFSNSIMDNSDLYKKIDKSTENINHVIKEINDKHYLVICRQVNLENNNYIVSYIKDVSKIYNNREYLFGLLLKLNIIISIVLVIVTIILSKAIVNPINKLITSTKRIAEGNFSERVKVASNDEVGMLSKQFNDMADVIEETINELETAAEDKQRFIDNLAHELRTPLTSIIGYSDFLRTNKCSEQVLIESLSCIYDAGRRLEKLSFTLMDLIMLRKEEFEMRDEKLKEVLLEVKNNMVYKLKNKNINLEITYDNSIFSINRSLIIILISNLIDNAIKVSKSGECVYLRGYREKDGIVAIEVEDKGKGISKEDIDKIFEPFFMIDKSRGRANGGVGLGLSLCKNIVEVHKGKIFVHSNVGEGTLITVKIPSSN